MKFCESDFAASVQDTILYNEFEIYNFENTAISLRGQLVKADRECGDRIALSQNDILNGCLNTFSDFGFNWTEDKKNWRSRDVWNFIYRRRYIASELK